MKKINLLIIFILVGAIGFMSSCDNEIIPVAAPIITLETGNTTILPGSDITIVGSIYAAGSIGTIIYFVDGEEYGQPWTGGFDSDTTTLFAQTFTNVTEEFTFQVQVTDLQDEPKTSNSSTITISLDDLIVSTTDLKIFCAVADQTGNEIFASLTPEFGTYTYAEADGDSEITGMIDVMYYNGNYEKDGEHPRLCSPDDAPSIVNSGDPLPNANTTTFKVLEGDEAALFSEWTSIADDSDIAIIDSNDSNTLTLSIGDIVAFTLENGKKGVLKVNSWTAGWGRDDYILIDVIVQKHAPAVN